MTASELKTKLLEALAEEITACEKAFMEAAGHPYAYDHEGILFVLGTQDPAVSRLGGALGVLHKYRGFLEVQRTYLPEV